MRRKDNKEKVESQENIKINYMQLVEQTDEEKLAMYMKLSKRELAQLVINCNKILRANLRVEQSPIIHPYPFRGSNPSDYPFPDGTFVMTSNTIN